MGLLLKLVKLSTDSIPSLKFIGCNTELGVVHKLAEGAPNLTVHILDKETFNNPGSNAKP